MKPPYIEETIPILKDESIQVGEKIDYLESWILKEEDEKLSLEKEYSNVEFYESGPKERRKSKLRYLARQIKNKEQAIKGYKIKLEKYKKIERDQKEKERQVGRPPDFLKSDTKKWHLELKETEEFQHKNGKPHLTNIRERIRELHEEKTTHKPSMKTIKNHYKDLELS